MINLDELIKKYPSVWEVAQEYPSTFLMYLAEEGVISQGDVTEWEEAILTSPMEAINHYRARYPDISIEYKVDREFVDALYGIGRISWDVHEELLKDVFEMAIPKFDERAAGVRGAVSRAAVDHAAAAYMKVLNSLYLWLKDHVPEFMDWLWGHVKSLYEQYWPPVKDKLEDMGRTLYDLTSKALLSVGEVTPERATELAVKMFGIALGAGVAAHAASVGFEMIHPFKSLGFHQMTGMIAQLGSFGPVAAATLGQVQYAALRVPMAYAVNKVTRSRLPDDQLLQIMAVKPDIPMDLFTATMQYHGYSDFWIDRIKATMFREPRYMELKMMAEDAATASPPSDVSDLARREFSAYGVPTSEQWLFMKARRAGYDPKDSRIFVDSLIKAATRTQRQDYYRQALNLFKEGYIQREHLNKVLAELELRPEAVTLTTKTAELMYLLDTISDEIKFWTDSYLKDLVTEEELELQLSLLGVNRWRVDLKVRLARLRKYKKPAQTEVKELESVMNKARSKYTQGYVTLYRNDRIDIETLYIYLVEIGIEPAVAEATCFLEEARKTK